MKTKDHEYLRQAMELSKQGILSNEGGPFGAIVVKNDVVIGRGFNRVTSTSDPTAHAEIVAIRDACQHLNSFQLEDCTIYSSCEPCPMCLGAIYWARPSRLVFACTREDAASIGFDDDFIYNEINVNFQNRKITTENLLRDEGYEIMKQWLQKSDRLEY